jgi:inner membrane protein involved in colicin E2 resistance
MTKRIAALTFIFLCATIAWFILGATIYTRTNNSGSRLKEGVASTWGTAQVQAPPVASYVVTDEVKRESVTDGKKTVQVREVPRTVTMPLVGSRIRTGLRLEHRQKGLLWYSTYFVDFAGTYRFRNESNASQLATFRLPFPAERAIYDGLAMEVNGQARELHSEQGSAFVAAEVPAGETATFKVAYRSQGLDSWRYKLGDDVAQARDFTLTMTTNFKDIDFAADTLSPTEKREITGGWLLTWRYESLVSGFQIGMTMPEKLQPGPLAGQVSFFAPVSLFLFFFVMFIVTTVRKVDLHPMNYFFLAAAFFSFHLLLAYLADHISIHLAFVISSAVSIALVVSYLRLVTGMRFAVVEAGLAQLVYLVLFSYAFFFKGFTGLAVTIGSILTLFVAMQVTGRIRWAEKFARVGAAAAPTSPAGR